MSAGHTRHGVSATEIELLSFFGCEPIGRDEGEVWLYNDNLYQTAREGVDLSFALAPACRDVRLRLEVGGHLVYEMNACAVDDVTCLQKDGIETLVIDTAPRARLLVTIDPAITLHEEIDNPP